MIRTRGLSILVFLFALAVSLLVAGQYRHPAHARTIAATQPSQAPLRQPELLSAYGALPLDFEQNQGQTDSRVKFLARGGGYTIFLADDESAVLALSVSSSPAEDRRDRALDGFLLASSAKRTEAVVRLALAGSNRQAPAEGLELRTGRSNYFIGNNPARWHSNVPHYARVRYRGVYPGVDLVYHGRQGNLESDYVVAPGADPSQIVLRIDGASKTKLSEEGRLVLGTPAGDVVLNQPLAYQDTPQGRQEVAVNYVQLGAHLVGLHVAPYDTRQPLIIDPTVASYSTYLGGAGNDTISAIAVDGNGAAYVTGFTTSTNFPVKNNLAGQGTFLATQTGAQETFIAKLNPAGTGSGDLIYSTYLGGTGSGNADQGFGIAVNSSGQAFVTGTTGATTDFPITSSTAFQTTNRNASGTAFLTQLDASGAILVYSTFLGGTGRDQGLAITLDATGNAYIGGVTTSVDFPITANAFQKSNGTTTPNGTSAFVARFDTTKAGTPSLIYSSYFGGTVGEVISAIAADASGNAYIAGQTSSPPPGFPIVNAFQPTLAGGINAFVAKLDTTGANGLLYSSYLGGSGSSSGGDQANGIAIDSNNIIYVVGTTSSTNFPVFPNPGAFQVTNKDQGNGRLNRQAFVSSFDTTKSGAASLIYSTYVGGSGSLGDKGYAITLDSLKQAYISGYTTSNDFPITPGAPQTILAGQNAYVFVLNATGSGMVFSTFWGGNGVENGFGIALDKASPPNILLAGDTNSLQGSFQITNGAFQTQRNGTGSGSLTDAFITKFPPASSGGGGTGVTVAPTSLSFGTLTVGTMSTAQTVTLTNNTTATIATINITISGTNAADFAQTTSGTCTTSLAASANCTIGVTFTPSLNSLEQAVLNIAFTGASGSPLQVALTGTGTTATANFSITASPTSTTITAGQTANFSLTVTSLNGFTGTVSATCAGAPAGSACTLTPTSVTLTANGNSTINGTLSTTARTVAPPLVRFPHEPRLPIGIWPLVSLVLALLAAWTATRRSSRKLAVGFALLALLSLSGCSGLPHTGTPAGTFTITASATAGALQHSATVSLTVN